MIEIEDKIVSLDVFEKEFVCNLQACKGMCCVEGDSGAPLEDEETAVLEKIFPVIRDYLSPDGITAIETQGTWEIDSDGDKVTPLVEGKQCAYVVFENDIAKCAIEHAHKDGLIDFPKPVSCHLYPVRIHKYRSFEAVNYDKWELCNPACALGQELKVPVYRFLEKPLIRKYGADWYAMLTEAAAMLKADSPHDSSEEKHFPTH